jgi:L-threonylcarbamoyladenylate synthase
MATLLGADGVTPADIAHAVEALRNGELVAFPTETVYGLGADASRAEAVAGIFTAKGRPTGHPLIVHMADMVDLERFGASVSTMANKLAGAFWPGPLTLVVERGDGVAPETVGGMSTVGLRVPDHPVALELLRAFGGGVAAPSANRFGSVSPTTAQHVLDDLGDDVDVVLDGGPSAIGVESTIIDVTTDEPRLLRPGGISEVEIEAVVNRPVVDGRTGDARAPGLLVSHYAPKAQVVLVDKADLPAALASANDDGLTVGVIGPVTVEHRHHWPLADNATAFAVALYATLREADAHRLDRLLVVPPSDGRLLSAVMDRLSKAAAVRP